MDREQLKNLVQSFLKTFGYIVKAVDGNGILFTRPTGLGVADELLIYFHQEGEETMIEPALKSLAGKYLRIPGGDEGRRFFLSPTPLGRVPRAVTEHEFKYQVPVWFFDREFSTAKMSTPLKQLEEDAAKHKIGRVEQTYRTGRLEGKDLLEELLKELQSPAAPCVRIILAPAGYGKTVLMSSLYGKLRERFIKNKQEQKMGARPLLMLPGHLKQATGLESLVNNFIGDEYDYGVSNKAAFEFWVKNDFVVWLLDGLEELILKIPDRFIEALLEEYIYAPGSGSPQIVIAIRKPVLATSPELHESIEEWEGSGLQVYELRDWEKEQKNSYFRKNLHLPSGEIENFIVDINQSESLQKICSVPYYCSLLADLKNNREMQIFNDDCELMAFAVERLCEREFDKGLDRDILPVNSQVELFVELAGESFKSNKLSPDFLDELAELFLVDIAEDARKPQVDCLRRHALLTQLGQDLDFTHDITKQYLIGVFLFDQLRFGRLETLDARDIEMDSVAGRYFIKNSGRIDWPVLLEQSTALSSSRNEEAVGLRNVMKVFLSGGVANKDNLLRDKLHNKNLSGLVFQDLQLREFRFQNSKLAEVEFRNCDLTGANLDGCYFKNTFFDSKNRLKGATTRGAVFESVKTDSRFLDDEKQIRRFFYEITQIEPEPRGPCQAVINLMKLLTKLVKKGRGFEMPQKFLIQTKCGGGIPASKCLDACIKNDFVSEVGGRVRMKINLFTEADRFVKAQEIGDHVREILNEICRDKAIGCQHVFQESANLR